MVTRFVGVKEFRQNISKIVQQARKKNERLILLKKNEPLAELRPLSKKDAVLEKLVHDVAEARKQVKRGEVYSLQEVMEHFGIE
jgi:antitoxin (DNA-binding transcriptional repressor) of toxin-antitoxin stability system